MDEVARAFTAELTDSAVARQGADPNQDRPRTEEPWEFLPSALNPGRSTGAGSSRWTAPLADLGP